MNTEQIKILKEKYHSGVSVRLISTEREPNMPEGLTGKVDFVDDTGQIHINWDNGSSLALICGIDKFIAFDGPTAAEYINSKLTLNDSVKVWYINELDRYTFDTIECIDANMLIIEAEQFIEKHIEISQGLNDSICFPCKTQYILDEFFSLHILTSEKIWDLKNKSEYKENESKAGRCPKCGNENIEYGSLSIEDT